MQKLINVKYLILGSVTFLAFYFTQFELHFPFAPYIDTIFVTDFSWKNFDSIALGMTKEQVLEVLGKPLYVMNSDAKECWRYSNDGKLYPFADFSWYAVNVCFDRNTVSSKPINEFFD